MKLQNAVMLLSKYGKDVRVPERGGAIIAHP